MVGLPFCCRRDDRLDGSAEQLAHFRARVVLLVVPRLLRPLPSSKSAAP